MDGQTKQVFAVLAIPNEEVRYIFRVKVLSWFDEKIKAKDRSEFCQA